MKNKSILLTVFLFFGLHFSVAQNSKIIEKLEYENYELKVIFFDPYENIVSSNPEFKSLNSSKQSEIWNTYLLNNAIYDFQLSQKDRIIKHYILRGNPSKNIYAKNLTRNNVYLLDIVDHKKRNDYFNYSEYSNLILRTIGELDFYGTLFENMESLLDNKGKLGKEIFGNFRLKIPYSTIRNNVATIVEHDLQGKIPLDWTVNNAEEYKNSFFSYQEKINQYFKIERIKKIYVRYYFENGEIKNELPQLKIDEDVKSFIGKMNRIGDVVSLPFFRSTDKPVLINKDSLKSKYKIEIHDNPPIEKYLVDIEVTKNSNGEIENISATLLIHGSSLERGEYIEKENYIAYYKTFKDIQLPYRILYSPITDYEFKVPRIEIELDYLFHKK